MALFSLLAWVMASFLPPHGSQPPPGDPVTVGRNPGPRLGDPFAPAVGLAGGGRAGLGDEPSPSRSVPRPGTRSQEERDNVSAEGGGGATRAAAGGGGGAGRARVAEP